MLPYLYVVITMSNTILVPTDGSTPARMAIQHARLLAEALAAEVHLLCVSEDEEGGLLDGVGEDAEFSDADDVVQTAAREFDGSAVETAIRGGDPAETILDYAEEISATLIVMGTHGRTGVHRFVSGSVTEQVTRLSEIPVFTLRADAETTMPDSYERILVPTDGSECAEAAVEEAVRLADAFDAEVHVVSVVDVNTVAAQSELTNARLVLDELEEQAEMATERIVELLDEHGIEGRTAVVQSAPATGIMDYADGHGIDVIVMGTHGRSGIGRFLLGSTTERLIRHAGVPVLSVRVGEGEQEEE